MPCVGGGGVGVYEIFAGVLGYRFRGNSLRGGVGEGDMKITLVSSFKGRKERMSEEISSIIQGGLTL